MAFESPFCLPRLPNAGFEPAFRQRVLGAFAALLIVQVFPGSSNAQPASCQPVVFLETFTGRVEVRRTGAGTSQPVKRDDTFCYGDTVVTGTDGAGVLRTLDGNAQRLKPDTELEIRPPSSVKRFILEIRRGAAMFLNRDPRDIAAETQHANAGPEGTEFVVSTSPEGDTFEMLEGALNVTSGTQSRRITEGESARVTSNGEIDAPGGPEFFDWAYFPLILDGPLPAPDAAPTRADDSDHFVKRAASRLRLGQVDQALEDLSRARSVDPNDARIDALHAMIAYVRGANGDASAFVDAALKLDPGSVPALLAASYVRLKTSSGDSAQRGAAAVRDVLRALETNPDSGLARARLAEVYARIGNYPASGGAARQATMVDPTNGAGFAMLGFWHSNAGRTAEALEAFERSTELDGMAPLPWLGKALVLWQQGRRDEAQAAANVAHILDPTNVDIRNYTTRLFIDEYDASKVEEQFAFAGRLDNTDPFAPFAQSFEQRSRSDSIAAFRTAAAAASRNAGVPPSSSTLGLDYDAATRAQGQAQLYLDTGTFEIGSEYARRMLEANPTNSAAHQFYADLTAQQRFGELAAVSNSFSAQALSKSIENVGSAQRDQLSRPGALRNSARNFAASDYDVPLTTDGFDSSYTAVSGSHNTAGASLAVAFREGQNTVSGSVFRNSSDGIRANSDFDDRGALIRFKHSEDPGRSLQLELGTIETESGVLEDLFFDSVDGPIVRASESADTVRFVGRLDQSEVNRRNPDFSSTILYSVFGIADDSRISTGPGLIDVSGRGSALGLRHILQTPQFTLDSGLSHAALRGHQTGFPFPPTILRQEFHSVYSYLTYPLLDSASLTVGLNADWSTVRNKEASEINGKLGLVWRPRTDTTLRLAFAESPPSATASTSRSNLQPSLEPTHVAGFLQVFFPGSERNRMRSAALEHEINESLFAGVAVRRRSTIRQYTTFGNALNDVGVEEYVRSAHLDWFASRRINVNAQYEADSYDADQAGVLDFANFETDRAILDFNYFSGRSLSLGLRATHAQQSGNFLLRGRLPGALPTFPYGEDEFTVFDFTLSHHLPHRRGVLDFRVDNLTDRHFRYQEPESDRIGLVPERTYSLHFTFALR